MRDTRNIECGIQDEKILAGSGCAHFSWWILVGCGIVLKLIAGVARFKHLVTF